MLARGNVNVERSVLPEEPEAAVDATVQRMREIAMGVYGSRSAKIRALAINIVRQAKVAEKDYYGEILAIHKWMQKNIRYIKDPINQETLSHPEELAFNTRAGDCDDMTVLEMALLGSIGIKSWPVVIGMKPGTFSHVYLRAQVPAGRHRKAGKIINLDPIMKQWAAGKEAPASRVKSHKDYRASARGSANMSGTDLGDPYGMLPGLGDYVTADSYLDDENAHVEQLLRPDLSSSTGSVANTPKVTVGMDGIDGYFSAGSDYDGNTVVEDVGIPTPMFNRDGLDQLGPKGPMTALSARESTQRMRGPQVRDIDAKVYDVPTVAGQLAKDRGRRIGVDSRKRIVTVKGTAAQELDSAKTPNEEQAEINGLGSIVTEVEQSFLPGLGGMGADEDSHAAAETSAIAAWWGRMKANLASARAGWAREAARQARQQGNAKRAQVADAMAAQEDANVNAALQLAERAGRISYSMARQDPALARTIAATDMALTERQNAVEGVERSLGAPLTEAIISTRGQMIQRPQRGSRDVTGVRRLEKGVNPYQRQQLALRAQRRTAEAKIHEIKKLIAAGKHRARARLGKRLRPIQAPIAIKAIRRPEEIGRRHMAKPMPHAQRPVALSVPRAVPTPGLSGFSGLANEPLILGAGAIAVLYALHRMK
jgi:hypothetical protein